MLYKDNKNLAFCYFNFWKTLVCLSTWGDKKILQNLQNTL